MVRRAAALAVAMATIGSVAGLRAQQARTFGSFSATTSLAYSRTRTPAARSAAIAWRCMTDGLNVIYLVGNEVGGREVRDVTIRSATDGHDAQTLTWTLLEGHRAAFLPRSVVEPFTRDALQAKTLALNTTNPTTGETFTDEFTLDGLRGALQYILPCQF